MSSSTPFRRRGLAAAGVFAMALVIVTVAALAGCGTTARTGARSAPTTASALPLVGRTADQRGPRDSFLTVTITPPVLKGAQACTAVRQPGRPVRTVINPGGPELFNPNVVAAVNLATGATARAATRSPGNPPSGLAWSPDGTMIAAVDSADNSIALLSAAHPDFSTARTIGPPRGCGFVTSTWTRSGLIAVEGCGSQDIDLSPGKLVQISPSGQPGAGWRLAACTDGVTVRTDPAAQHVLVEEDLGYGSGRPCGAPKPGGQEIRIAQVRGNRLQTAATWPTGPVQLMLTGWQGTRGARAAEPGCR